MSEISHYISNINIISMESSINVCDAIIKYIDKVELIKEYSENEEFVNIFTESMSIFMETHNPNERDRLPKNEISKWMESKGYWYTGDNPKKKKECNRMYHFLQQHKFDPKSQTYESDIDDNGVKRRIKLTIDSLNKYMSLDFTEAQSESFNRESKTINLHSKTLKSKQHNSQLTLKHEEGHAKSYSKGKGNKSFYDDPDNSPRANKHLSDAKNNKQYINKHDYSAEELNADLYAAKNAKIRTSKKGGHDERNANLTDVRKFFEEMSRALTKECLDSLSVYKTRKSETDKDLKTLSKILKKKEIDLSDFETLSRLLKKRTDVNKVKKGFIGTGSFISSLSDVSKELIKIMTNIDNNDSCDNQAKSKMKKIASSIHKSIENSITNAKKFTEKHKSLSDTLNKFSKMSDNVSTTIKSKLYDITVNSNLRKVLKDIFDLLKEEREFLQKKIKENDDQIEESTKVRYEFVKKYINEYFENMISNDCFIINDF